MNNNVTIRLIAETKYFNLKKIYKSIKRLLESDKSVNHHIASLDAVKTGATKILSSFSLWYPVKKN